MSWQLTSLIVLAAALIAGGAWYERSKPPSQVVALVAALAALAIAGRIAFAPIPNVVPTTDIALISGYALGGPPGFAVGALAALVSNFWLGQGPWTPWQMAGWGMTGVLGALLAAGSGRSLGRFGLAFACALAGLAYGALLDFSLMVTYGGEQSLERLLAISARGVPFNLAHAAGNFTLALVAGPALVRMLGRYRARFEFAWGGAAGGDPARSRRPGALTGAACLIAAIVGIATLGATEPSGAAPSQPQQRAAGGGPGAALAWLGRAQNDDGGFGTGPGERSSPEMTGWAVLGMEAAGRNPIDARAGSRSPISYLRSTASRIRTTGDIERTILVLEAAGLEPRRFAGRDLVARLLSRRRGDGSWGSQVNGTAFGVLALEAAGRPRGNGRSAAWLRAAQNGDGGWGFAPGAASDADSSGAALQALVAAGGSRGSIARGVRWLRVAQRPGGGFNLAGGPVNSQSTAWAIQGLVAAGVAPARVRRGGRSPLDYLASVQAGNGHYRYSRSYDQTPVWVTGQALQAASRKAFPLAAVSRSSDSDAQGKGSGGASSAVPDGAGVPPGAPGAGSAAAKPGGAGSGKPKRGTGAQGADPPAPRAAPSGPIALAPASEVGEPRGGGGGDSRLPELAAAVFAALVAAAGLWLLRRQSRPG